MTREECAIQVKALFDKVQERYNLAARTEAQNQLHALVQGINDELNKINMLCDNKKTRILHTSMDKVRENNIRLQSLAADLNNPFLLFVVGDGKFGKSTLINALIGCEAAEAGQLPRTWKIDVFYGEEGKQAEIRYRDGSAELKTFEETKRILAEEERKFEASEDLIETELMKYQEQLKSIQAKREKKEELRKYKLYRSPITEVHWPMPVNSLLKNFRLVDTPGINQRLSIGSVEANAVEYYSKADGIIWLLAADKIAAKDTRENIDDIIARFGQRTDNVIAVLNKIDRVESDGGPEAVQRVIADAYRFYGDVFKEIIPLSASMAFDAVLENDCAAMDKSGLNQLRRAIDRRFLTGAQQIQIMSKAVGASTVLEDTRIELAGYAKRLEEDSARRVLVKHEWKLETEKIIKLLNKLVDDCFNAQLEAVRRNAQAYQEQLWDMPKHERQSFLQDKVFEHSTFEVKIDKILYRMVENIKAARDIHMRESAFFEYPNLQKEEIFSFDKKGMGMNTFTISDQTFSINDSSLIVGGVAAIGAAALLGPLGLLAYFFVETNFGKSVVKMIAKQFINLPNKITDSYNEKLVEVKKNIIDNITRAVKNAGKNVEDVREITYADLHGKSIHTDNIKRRINSIMAITELKITPLKVSDIILGK